MTKKECRLFVLSNVSPSETCILFISLRGTELYIDQLNLHNTEYTAFQDMDFRLHTDRNKKLSRTCHDNTCIRRCSPVPLHKHLVK